jgi:predicted nucleotide-binding protein
MKRTKQKMKQTKRDIIEFLQILKGEMEDLSKALSASLYRGLEIYGVFSGIPPVCNPEIEKFPIIDQDFSSKIHPTRQILYIWFKEEDLRINNSIKNEQLELLNVSFCPSDSKDRLHCLEKLKRLLGDALSRARFLPDHYILDLSEQTKPSKAEKQTEEKETVSYSNKIFIIHGHAMELCKKVQDFLTELGLEPVILNEQPAKGQTIVEKFERVFLECGFAIGLYTQDDKMITKDDKIYFQARPNVILEIGYCWGKLGRDKMAILYERGAELPSDLFGINWHDSTNDEQWQASLTKELRAAGYTLPTVE